MEKQLVLRAIKISTIYYLSLRILISGVLCLVMVFIPPQLQPSDPNSQAYLVELQSQSPFSSLFLSPWYRWDTVHYIEIAENGYRHNLTNTVWPPLYPLFIKLLSAIISPSILAALIVSNFSALIAFILFYLLVTNEWGEDAARKSLLWLAAFPAGFFLLAAYSESLFLALSIGCLYAFRKSKLILAGILGSAALLTRIQGVLLVIPISWEIYQNYRANHTRLDWKLIYSLIPNVLITITAIAYLAYIRIGLNADWPWVTLSAAWEQHLGWPWEGLL